jgi:hypothetical protein
LEIKTTVLKVSPSPIGVWRNVEMDLFLLGTKDEEEK